MKPLITTLIITSIFFIGCEDQNNDFNAQQENYSDRESELSSLIEDDDALGLEGLDDGGEADDEYTAGSLESTGKIKLGKVMEVFHPDNGYIYRFGRKINSVSKTIIYSHEEDFSIADITRTISGHFICVVIDTATADTNKTEKPFTSEFHRMVRFVEGDSTDTNGRRWRVDAFTLGIGSTDEMIAITKLEYFTMNSTGMWESGFVMTGDDAETTWIFRDSIPTFHKGDSIKVEVSVINNSDPVFDYKSGEGVVMHYGRHRYYKARKKMYDNLEPDGNDPIYDNIFTKIWKVHGPGYYFNNEQRPSRVFRAFFDVIDYGTLFDTEEDVHTAVWALPYRVIR